MSQFTNEYIPVERRVAFKRGRADQRREFIERQYARNPRCFYCRCPTELKPRGHNTSPHADHFAEQFATLDHAVPLAMGGKDHPANWRLACAPCNSLKGATDDREFIALLKREGIRD